MLAWVLAVTLACDPVPVVPSADERQNSEAARIEGDVVFSGTARGNVVLFLFDAARPPPPEGTGRPLSFAFIPGEKLFSAAMDDGSDAGPFTAHYAFSLVPEGKYLIRGFLDRDGCLPQVGCRDPDFIPWYGVTGEPSAGDVGGGAVDPLTREPRVIEIARGEDGRLRAATDVQVSFLEDASTTIPVDRPAFRVNGERALDLSQPASFFELVPAVIVERSITATAFLAQWVDDDHDGVPDDADHDGVPEFWPKVFVRKLADGPVPLLDENDLDHDGVIDPTGVDYPHADGTSDGLPDQVVLAAGLVPDAIALALTNMDGTPKMTPVPVPKLDLVVRPLALDARDPSAPVPLASVPPGRYAIVVVQLTGQTWRVPNELQPGFAGSAGLPAVESQAFFLEVKP
ncbi:MAG: hypothetical protein IRZ16_15385 [Myxococcaceae bacterium]|nr:hypothetical protein [Myxococcaceae bacterium]